MQEPRRRVDAPSFSACVCVKKLNAEQCVVLNQALPVSAERRIKADKEETNHRDPSVMQE